MLKTLIVPLALFATAAPVFAGEGPWKVGEAQVVRAESLDLARAEDRQLLLQAVETAANRACRAVRTRGARAACRADAMEAALAHAPRAREAVAIALTERDGARLASNP